MSRLSGAPFERNSRIFAESPEYLVRRKPFDINKLQVSRDSVVEKTDHSAWRQPVV